MVPWPGRQTIQEFPEVKGSARNYDILLRSCRVHGFHPASPAEAGFAGQDHPSFRLGPVTRHPHKSVKSVQSVVKTFATSWRANLAQSGRRLPTLLHRCTVPPKHRSTETLPPPSRPAINFAIFSRLRDFIVFHWHSTC